MALALITAVSVIAALWLVMRSGLGFGLVVGVALVLVGMITYHSPDVLIIYFADYEPGLIDDPSGETWDAIRLQYFGIPTPRETPYVTTDPTKIGIHLD